MLCLSWRFCAGLHDRRRRPERHVCRPHGLLLAWPGGWLVLFVLLLAAAARSASASTSLTLPACQQQCVTGTVSVSRAVQPTVVCTFVCVCVCLQAAPNLQYFSKGASAGARLFAVINRQPAIDAGTPRACGPRPCAVLLFCCASAYMKQRACGYVVRWHRRGYGARVHGACVQSMFVCRCCVCCRVTLQRTPRVRSRPSVWVSCGLST